jgi:hypothetical protein
MYKQQSVRSLSRNVTKTCCLHFAFGIIGFNIKKQDNIPVVNVKIHGILQANNTTSTYSYVVFA